MALVAAGAFILVREATIPLAASVAWEALGIEVWETIFRNLRVGRRRRSGLRSMVPGLIELELATFLYVRTQYGILTLG